MLGKDNHSWAWDIPSRELLHNGASIGRFCNGFAVPKSVSLVLDCDAKELWFELESTQDLAQCVHFTGKRVLSARSVVD